MKTCNKCSQLLGLNFFYKGAAICKKCISDLNKEFRSNREIETRLVPALDGEVWLNLIGFEKYYRISSFGRITSLCKSVRGIPRKRKEEKLLKAHINSTTGYYAYVFSHFDKSIKDRRYNIHRVVAIHFIPNPLNLAEVNHIDGDKLNNNVSNLEWVSREENIRHGFRNGLIKTLRGESAHNSKLTDDIVLFIYNSKTGPRQLSRDLGIKYSNIASIRNGITWNHVTGAPKKYYGKEKLKERYAVK